MADFESNDWWQGTNLETVHANSMEVVDRLSGEMGGSRKATEYLLSDGLQDPELLLSLPRIHEADARDLREELPEHARQVSAGARILLQRAATSTTERERAVNSAMWLAFIARHCMVEEARGDLPSYLPAEEYAARSRAEQGNLASSQVLLRGTLNMLDYTNMARENLLFAAMRDKGSKTSFKKGRREHMVRELRHYATLLTRTERPGHVELPFTGHYEPVLDEEDYRYLYAGVDDEEGVVEEVNCSIEDTVAAIELLFMNRTTYVDDDENVPVTDFEQLQFKLLKCLCEILERHHGAIPVREIGAEHPLHGVPPNYRADYVILREDSGPRFTKDVMAKYIHIVEGYKQGLKMPFRREEDVTAEAMRKMAALWQNDMRKQRSERKRDFDKEKRMRKEAREQRRKNRRKGK